MVVSGPKAPEDDLVPSRSCGECSVCCEVFLIDTPELQKAQDVLCPHCVKPAGCGIYPHRPPVCREWHCGWRRMPELDWRWRPDRCGILVEPVSQRPSLTGLNVMIVGGPEVIGWPPLVEYAASLASAGVPVSLSAHGKLGYVLGMTGLNDRLMSAACARDPRRLRRELSAALTTGLASAD